MPVPVSNRREERRSRVFNLREAKVEFTGPDGTAHRWPLIDLSLSGGSFLLADRIPDLEVGATGTGGLIVVGESEIHVNFQVRHVTHDFGQGYACGVQLFTVGDKDRNEIAALVSRLERSV